MSTPKEKRSRKVTSSPVAPAEPIPPPPPTKRLPLARIARLLARHLRRRERGGNLFAFAGDDLRKALALGLPPDEMIVLPDGRALEVQDRLRTDDQTIGAWKVTERYALKELSDTERRRRAAEAARQAGKEAGK